MHTRISTLHPKTERFEIVQGRLTELFPVMQRQEGFLGATVISDSDTVVCMTLWQSEANMEASRKSEYFQDSLSRIITFLRRPPEVKSYAVNAMS